MLRKLSALIVLLLIPAVAQGQWWEPTDLVQRLPVPKASTEAIGPLSLADLERFAFSCNPTLALAAARLGSAHGKRVQAGLFPNPVVGYHATEIGNLGTAGQQGGFISQRIRTGGKLRLDRAIADTEVAEAQFHLRDQEQRVLSDVRVRFYDALVAQRRVELSGKLARIGDDLVTATKKLLQGRLVTENDLLLAEIKADESRILFGNARNQHVEAWRRMAAVAGVPHMPMTWLVGDLESDLSKLDWDQCLAIVFDENPELNAAQARAEQAGIALRRARREPIPDVDLSVSIRHHNVTRDDVANVQVGVPIPVFNRNQGNIRSAEAEWAAANSDIRRIQLDLQDRMAVAFRRYANARQQLDRYRERIVPRAKRSLKLVTDGYEIGQVKFLDLLTSQQTYLQVNLSYLDSLRELKAAVAEIEGQLLTGSLTSRH